MAVTIIDADMIDSIRRLLGVTEDVLPDDTVTDALIGEAAEREVMSAVGDPAYADRPADEQASIRQAVAYLTAAKSVATLRSRNSVKSEKFNDQYQIQYDTGAIDLATWASSLRAQAFDAITSLTEGNPLFLGMFTLAHAGRRC